MAPPPPAIPPYRSGKEYSTTPSKTPQSRHRLHFPNPRTPNQAVPTEHPVEVIGRIRDHPDRKEKPSSSLEITSDGRSVRLRTDNGYRDFTLDGVSVSEEEDLGGFYKRFVESRIKEVRLGAKCTVMMYGPTGSGKSHTMFGCAKQQGIVYRALRDILGEGEEDKENNGGVDYGGFGVGLFVQVAVLEIYNEEIYDLLSGSCGSGATVGVPKANVPKTRLEVMGKKAKNATYITGNEAIKISREVAKVEKRRIVKSTLCNERSSRSHCLIILDVPSVGGRLMLVDMAGSENIEQSGQSGLEAKLQTAKINQGNIALKRVVESIANGDSHVPFRDSKLTMLLQDSFEDDKSKMLMILCASPDPKEMHKTMSTFEYGAKAKCIVRIAHVETPRGEPNAGETSVMMGSRIAAMNQFICKLQMENKLKEEERDDARKELQHKEEELEQLRRKLTMANEEEINSKVGQRTMILKLQLEKMQLEMEEQRKELILLRQRLKEAEKLGNLNAGRFVERLAERCREGGDEGMEKSMELDMGDQPTVIHEVREVPSSVGGASSEHQEEDDGGGVRTAPNKLCLSTVLEGDEEEEEDEAEAEEVVEKEVVREEEEGDEDDGCCNHPESCECLGIQQDAVSRSTRIQNIFRLCGNYRELTRQVKIPTPPSKKKTDHHPSSEKENLHPGELVDVYVKWETSTEASRNLIAKMKIGKDASLADLRKVIEAHLAGERNQPPAFKFLLLGGDPTGAPVAVDMEGGVKASKLPACNGQLRGHLACLRPIKKKMALLPPLAEEHHHHLPLEALEHKLAAVLHLNSSVGENPSHLSGVS